MKQGCRPNRRGKVGGGNAETETEQFHSEMIGVQTGLHQFDQDVIGAQSNSGHMVFYSSNTTA